MLRISVRSVSLFVASFAIALVSAPNGSPTVYAGCGDYVHIGRNVEGSTVDAHRADAGTGDLPGGAGKPVTPPCQGPSCRQNPLAPMAPGPLQTINGSDDKACLEREVETPPVGRQQMAVDAPICRDELAGLRIERPPRGCS